MCLVHIEFPVLSTVPKPNMKQALNKLLLNERMNINNKFIVESVLADFTYDHPMILLSVFRSLFLISLFCHVCFLPSASHISQLLFSNSKGLMLWFLQFYFVDIVLGQLWISASRFQCWWAVGWGGDGHILGGIWIEPFDSEDCWW